MAKKEFHNVFEEKHSKTSILSQTHFICFDLKQKTLIHMLHAEQLTLQLQYRSD